MATVKMLLVGIRCPCPCPCEYCHLKLCYADSCTEMDVLCTTDTQLIPLPPWPDSDKPLT